MEGVRQLNWFSGLPSASQTAIVVGAISVLVQPVFIYVTHRLGRAQGKAQVRHEKSSQALVEACNIVRGIQQEVGLWALMRARNNTEMEQARKLLALKGQLRDLVTYNSPWFDPRTQRKIERVLKVFGDLFNEHADALAAGDQARADETGTRIYEWHFEPLALLIIDLEDEARRLIGSRKPWYSTWWGKPLRRPRNWLRKTTGKGRAS